MRIETQAVHGGMADVVRAGLHAAPIDLSSTYVLPDLDVGGVSYETLAMGGQGDEVGTPVYARLWNPTVARFEESLAGLEQTDGAVAFSSGMAALTAILMACVSEGLPHIVAVRPLYGGTDHLLASSLLGTRVTFVDPAGVAQAIQSDTGMVIVETPANPSLELVDIAAVAREAGNIPVMVDNTFATPVLQRPATVGATLVMHSATKYLGGHGDVVGGVVATNEEWLRKLRHLRVLTGAILHPLAGYLLHRGLRTLPLRVRAQQATAAELAARLSVHPSVERVLYPGLPGQDSLGLLGRQMEGPGAMVSVVLEGGIIAAERLISSCRLFTHAVSLGGVDSLIQHPASLTHRPVAAEARPSAGLVRLSVGLEHVDDLYDDLDRALRAS